CGHSIISYKHSKYPGWYYRCTAQRKKGNAVCQCGFIPRDAVDTIILEKLQREFGDKLAQERFYAGAQREAEERLTHARQGLTAIRRDLTKLEEAEARVRKLLRDGAISPEEYREQREDIGAEAAGLRAQANKLESVIRELEASRALQDQQREMGERIREIHKLPIEQQKQILRHFVQAITLFRDKGSSDIQCDVQWRWSGPRMEETAALISNDAI
ncbi:MAG: recombinase zinc beta ribbon domain-containing protein, partial [Bacteroidota bacterium]